MSKSRAVLYRLLGVFLPVMFFCVLVPVVSFAKDPQTPSDKSRPKIEVIPVVPQEDYVYDAGGKRDPFIPLITSDGRFLQLERTPEEEEAELLKMDGIIYDKYGLSYAIVDGSVVKVGDMISDYQVLTIEETKVSFIREGQIKEVFLQKED